MHRLSFVDRALVVSAALLVTAFVTCPATAQVEKPSRSTSLPSVVYSPGTAPVTLSDGTGDRSLTVGLDGYGSFGSATPAGDALFDPVGSIGPAGTVYRSGVLLGSNGSYLSTDEYGNLPPIPFTSVTATTAMSAFNAGSLHVVLTQSVMRTANGSILEQAYNITNMAASTQYFTVTRYVDGDLAFDGSYSSDFGGVSPDQRTLYEFDAGDDPGAASTFVGITDTGGDPAGFTIQSYPFLDSILESAGIPSGLLNQVAGDNNGDGVTDTGYDVTLSLASSLTIPGGQSVVYTSTTRFGDQSLTPRAMLVWDPPDFAGGGDNPPPQHLRAVPLSSAPGVAAADVEQPRGGVTGYKVYSSSTSPVVPGPSTLFTSVPPGQLSSNVPTSGGGSFFVVTANYGDASSGPSNEATADVPAATLTTLKVTSAKVVGKGSGFSSTVTVFLDGIPFAAPAKVKGSTKVAQKGTLVTGQTVGAYLASHGGVALVQFRNSNGGIAARRYPQ